MLEIKNITKIYESDGFVQKALDGVSVNFRKSEFASILGPSGSGKTTFLNIIGGLDHYTSGDLIINGISTKKYKDADWDSYRNHRIGFVFQSYNLISHQTILSNVKLALTLSGISKKEATERAKQALIDVGLEKHINKRPSQLSGGQMQRVAIARALVNNPDILLADEPTGALDSETSIQIMNILKKIAKTKLVIMVTHNPDLAKEYSTRIINIKDGKIIGDSNPFSSKESAKEDLETSTRKKKKTSMKFKTALSLSFNNLMTKKARTILVALAGSIGIIGIALIMSVSNGFQNYVDSIQEEALTSYPLSIMEEATDVTSILLSMTSGGGEQDKTKPVQEKQFISSMLGSVSSNDLRSLKKHIEKNYDEIKDDLKDIKYTYSIDPLIYSIDATKKLAKLNPSNLFDSFMGGSGIMSSYSSFSSIYSEMKDNLDDVKDQYNVLAGRYPDKYDEALLVLSEPNGISDLLVYSLGLRDNEELTKMVTSIMSGEGANVNNEPMSFTYEDLMNVDLRVILPTDTYKYNEKYDIYEDMTDDNSYMKNLYVNKSIKLKIVGIVCAKPGTNTMALQPGVSYTSKLTQYIIDYSKNTDIVKKQMANSEIDVFSGNRFDSAKNNFNIDFSDLLTVDQEMMKSAFGMNVDENTIKSQTTGYMNEIAGAITTNVSPAKKVFDDNLKYFIDGLFNSITGTFDSANIDTLVNNYLTKSEVTTKLKAMEKDYIIPADTFKLTYQGLLKGALSGYVTGYQTAMMTDSVIGITIIPAIKTGVIEAYLNNMIITATSDQMAKGMTEAKMKTTVLTKVGELTTNLMGSLASGFNVDSSKITGAFKLKYTEDEITRLISAMMTTKQSTQKSNLISLGYQDKDDPTLISFYFSSFDGKEHFMKFLDDYNDSVDDEHKVRYTDTTGILMGSVKTIVNAVSYVLIAFVSISLVVSSIMIGVITYISVYERTKEIGILRAIGASKGNISSIFNAETFIIGFLSGFLGIAISYLMIPIINAILHHYTGNIPLSATLPINSALKLVVLSIILTIIGGLIPANKASKKDPVEALRSE